MQSDKVVKIFISCPGDVATECSITLSAIDEFNLTWAEWLGLRFSGFSWKQNVVSATGKDAQAVIDLQLQTYDVYLGIMGTRFGQPTSTAGSGTEQEFDQAMAGKHERDCPSQVSFYFSNRSQTPSEIDAGQLMKVQSFKEKVSKTGVLYQEYSGYDHFSQLVRMQLSKLAQDYMHPVPPTQVAEERPSKDNVQSLLKRLGWTGLEKTSTIPDVVTSLLLESTGNLPRFMTCLDSLNAAFMDYGAEQHRLTEETKRRSARARSDSALRKARQKTIRAAERFSCKVFKLSSRLFVQAGALENAVQRYVDPLKDASLLLAGTGNLALLSILRKSIEPHLHSSMDALRIAIANMKPQILYKIDGASEYNMAVETMSASFAILKEKLVFSLELYEGLVSLLESRPTAQSDGSPKVKVTEFPQIVRAVSLDATSEISALVESTMSDTTVSCNVAPNPDGLSLDIWLDSGLPLSTDPATWHIWLLLAVGACAYVVDRYSSLQFRRLHFRDSILTSSQTRYTMPAATAVTLRREWVQSEVASGKAAITQVLDSLELNTESF